MKIVTICNHGYVEMTRNLLASLGKVGIQNNDICIVSLDEHAQQSLAAHGFDSILWKSTFVDSIPNDFQGYSSEKTSGFSRVTYEKPQVVLSFLERNMDLLFVDGDIVFLRDPRTMLENYVSRAEIDGVFQDSTPDPNKYCTGFFYLRPSPRNSLFWKNVYHCCKQNVESNQMHANDQIVLNTVYRSFPREMLPSYELLGQNLFPDGKAFFEGKTVRRDFAFIVHNNWIAGNAEKIERFKEVGMWYI